jgi:hypothetical protein
MTPEPKSFVVICREVFGQKPGQDLASFALEVRDLNPKDREDLIAEFLLLGYKVRA